jgi:NADH-quinone oxidoreductase subunit F
MVVKIVSQNFDIPQAHTLEVARAHGRYCTLDKLFTLTRDSVVEMISQSGLRGKGGGGALTGAKWQSIVHPSKKPVYLVINADEGEPGTFKDRQIFERDPHLLIEGIIASCYALGAHDCYIYIRGEFHFQCDRMQHALDEAYAEGLLGNTILGHDYRLDVTITKGAGGYICGEKSALLESLEGKRGNPRLKPHNKKAPEWFYGNPTVVNNVETIATIPYIVEYGAEGYRQYGTQQSPGTLLFAISGHVERPGVYEVPFGTKMLDYIEQLGGGVRHGKALKAVIPGGSSCRVLTASEVESAFLDYESMRELGSELGTGGMIVMDEETNMVEVLKNLLEFYHHESCGQCTPCREGTGWADKILGRILENNGNTEDVENLLQIADTMNGKTICVFAPAVSGVIRSYITKFRDEFDAYVKDAPNG